MTGTDLIHRLAESGTGEWKLTKAREFLKEEPDAPIADVVAALRECGAKEGTLAKCEDLLGIKLTSLDGEESRPVFPVRTARRGQNRRRPVRARPGRAARGRRRGDGRRGQGPMSRDDGPGRPSGSEAEEGRAEAGTRAGSRRRAQGRRLRDARRCHGGPAARRRRAVQAEEAQEQVTGHRPRPAGARGRPVTVTSDSATAHRPRASQAPTDARTHARHRLRRSRVDRGPPRARSASTAGSTTTGTAQDRAETRPASPGRSITGRTRSTGTASAGTT